MHNHLTAVEIERQNKEIEKKVLKEVKGLGGTGGKINKGKMNDLKKIYGYKEEKKAEIKPISSTIMAN